MNAELEAVMSYHQTSKHGFRAYAPGPRFLEMEIRPDPFLNYRGAQVLKLDTWSEEDIKSGLFPTYEQAFRPEKIGPSGLNRTSVSQLLFDSFALSVWKRTGSAQWALRINPSSGNLHPTEVYLISGPVPKLLEKPSVCHYAPLQHALEVRTEFSRETWEKLSYGFPEGTFFIGFASIYWRVAWKYGVRAFRYANHDLGHAIAALTFAAAGLGWKTCLLSDMASEDIARVLGISGRQGPEREEPACLLAVYPSGKESLPGKVPLPAVADFEKLSWNGVPNRLSPEHVEWAGIETASSAARKGETGHISDKKPETKLEKRVSALSGEITSHRAHPGPEAVSLRSVIHRRRSAIEMNNSAYMDEEDFYGMLRRTLPNKNLISGTLAFGPFAHLLIFVNRVKGLREGLYIFLRKPGEKEEFKARFKPDFLWEKPENCPYDLELYMLVEEALYDFAAQLSCSQRKAADACFTACMLSEFEEPLKTFGSWMYPYLFWECGALGQILYLEAEARGFRGCGIGCFFDDPLHEILGLEGLEYQDLYHFAVGSPLQEIGVVTFPAYRE
ncbi:nitroreductase family protein [Methanosarcina hadiensis]|uniref:nitroreductase family protein n=1 Tax=Methanosarcina hadiensis TaxID=3078083 RepID=UPI0039775EFF